jgi:hypothetical protein
MEPRADQPDQPDHAALLDEIRRLADQQERLRREMVRVWRDVHALGGMPTVTGYTTQEWLELVCRSSGFDARRLERFATRLPALPATAAALDTGAITVDQAAQVVDATVRLSGDTLRAVDRRAAALASDANRRRDWPDLRDDLDGLVRDHLPVRTVERAERRRQEGQRLLSQPDLDGGGWLYAELDPVGYATATAAIEHAAGPPAPDEPRRRQRAAGLVAIAAAWCAAPDHGASRPAVTVVVDIADVTTNTAGTLLGTAGRGTPRLTARTVETLACDADLLVQLHDGARPLAVLRDREQLPDRLRAIVKRRDRGCRWPGCTAPPWQVDVHHLHHRGHGGDHDVDNLLCLCRRHHRLLHGPRWSARLDGPTGELRLWLGRPRPGREPTHVTRPPGTTAGGERTDGPAPRQRQRSDDHAPEPGGVAREHPARYDATASSPAPTAWSPTPTGGSRPPPGRPRVGRRQLGRPPNGHRRPGRPPLRRPRPSGRLPPTVAPEGIATSTDVASQAPRARNRRRSRHGRGRSP